MLSDVSAQSKPDAANATGLFNRICFSPRREFQFGALEAVVLVTYTALVAWTVAHHIPWADEAQAWLIARDSSLSEIFRTDLRYEGSPGLWHFFLWILCRLHISFAAMRWISPAIPVAGIWVFLRYSPFPLILRVAVPFSFYLLYQYAVLARSYVAVPLLVFIAAMLFSKPGRNIVWLAIVLGLMANLCSQGFCISLGLAAMLVLRLWRQRADSQLFTRNRFVAASLVLCALWAFAAWSAAPTRDNRYMPEWDPVYQREHMAERQKAFVDSKTLASESDAMHFRGYNRLKHIEYRFTTGVTKGLSNSWIVSVLFAGAVLLYLGFTKNLFDFLPYVLLQILFTYVAGHAWHLGNIFVALVGILWIDWPLAEQAKDTVWRRILTLALLAIVIEQCFWSVRAIRADTIGKYSGDKEAAEFLASHMAGKTVAGFGYHCIGVLPYFNSNIFENQSKKAFWHWKSEDYVDDRVKQVVATHPDYIDVGFAVKPRILESSALKDPNRIETFRPDTEDEILATGFYRETHRFCGDAFSGHGYDEGECQVIMEPTTH
jgi:hypothetical protein